MSTASPLPVHTPPPGDMPASLRQQVSSRLAQHRQRRPRTVQPDADPQTVLPLGGDTPAARRRVADSVAARFAESTTYREFLQAEAAEVVRRANAAAAIAQRTAEAVSAAHTELLSGLGDEQSLFAPTIADAGTVTAPDAVCSSMETETPLASVRIVGEPAAPPSPWETLAFEAPEPAIPLPANLIEFPRQLVAARKARPRLAEGPLRDEADAAPERAQLRIFEVEAAALSPEPAAEAMLPEWHSIRLDPHAGARAEAAVAASSALPIYAAPVSLRMMAFTVDACCITGALLAAVAVAAYASPELPGGLAAAVAATGSLVAFVLLYYMLFFTLNEATPGMRYARIALCTFSDENPTRSSMRKRLLAVLLAGLPLGLGLAWACLDEDGLGWHDRISRMYPREY